MKKKSSFFIPLLLVLFLLLMFALAFFIYQCSAPASSKNEIEVKIEVPSGMSVQELASLLKEKSLIRSEKIFYLAARYRPLGVLALCPRLSLKSGVYYIKSSMNLSKIFSLVSSGAQEYIRLVIAEGLTISKIANKLEEASVCSALDFKNICKDKGLLEEYKISASSLEGYLFPDTYFFTQNMKAEECARIMIKNFFSRIDEIPSAKNLSQENFYQKLILASIVEREYRVKDEAPLIASVFQNRLENGIGLYSCATIEYIITEIQGKEHPGIITYADLKIDSPYNTYKWAALPPTPISNPGLTALRSVFECPKTDYFYFRLIDAQSGRHAFSKDFSSHIREGDTYTPKR